MSGHESASTTSAVNKFKISPLHAEEDYQMFIIFRKSWCSMVVASRVKSIGSIPPTSSNSKREAEFSLIQISRRKVGTLQP